MKIAQAVWLVVAAVLLSPHAAAQSTDNLIAPGQRIGAASLGMTAADLYNTLGAPANSFSHDGVTYYNWAGLQVRVPSSTQRVESIFAWAPQYRTAQGVGVGSSDLEIRAKFGQPECEGDVPGCIGCQKRVLIYGNGGLGFVTNHGTVDGVAVPTHYMNPKPRCAQ